MAHVLKAQIWLADINDLPRMEDAWRAAFPQDPPARTVLSAADFGVTGGIIEINLVAVRRDGRTRKEIVSARCPVPIGHASPAVRAGDLLFLSGLFAATGDGVIPPARIDRGFPYAGSSLRVQTEWILEQADALCRAAGTELGAAARQQLFYTDLHEFDASFRSIAARFGDALPATSVVRVPAMAVPGCGVTMDIWVVSG
jgi:enamine deaminase RidA (YjgF/YER057c/UK114 family)